MARSRRYDDPILSNSSRHEMRFHTASVKSGRCDDLLIHSKAAVPSSADRPLFAMLGDIGDRNRVAIRRKN
jgi:hypothetical protein